MSMRRTLPIPEKGRSPHNSARAASVISSSCGRARVVDNPRSFCTIMGPIAVAVLLFLTRSALAETDPSRQIVATDQGGGAYHQLYDPE